jgi:hypothetical protein
MKLFEVIHLVLMLALLVGVPVAAATRSPGEPFSLVHALKQAGVTAGVVLLLLLANFTVARALSRSGQRKK